MQEITKRFWLEKFDCFSISGKDAKKFLNGITTGNIINSNNKVLKTCWLTPNGVLRSLIEIIFLDKKLEVIILEGDINEIKEFFNKIIFPSDDVFISDSFSINRLQEVDQFKSWKIYQPIFLKNDYEGYEIYQNKTNLLNSSELKLWKINQAIPSLDNEINGKNNPLELGLTDLIDFKKGCYLGQETISKIKNASSLKQEIRVWTSCDPFLNFQFEDKYLFTNSNKEKSVGRITSFQKFDCQIKGLAMIKRKYLEIGNSFYSGFFGKVTVEESVGSSFL